MGKGWSRGAEREMKMGDGRWTEVYFPLQFRDFLALESGLWTLESAVRSLMNPRDIINSWLFPFACVALSTRFHLTHSLTITTQTTLHKQRVASIPTMC